MSEFMFCRKPVLELNLFSEINFREINLFARVYVFAGTGFDNKPRRRNNFFGKLIIRQSLGFCQKTGFQN